MSSLWITIITAFLTALPPTLLALAALIASIRNGAKLNEVHLTLNSRLTQLVEAARAQGIIDERNYQDAKNTNNSATDSADKVLAIQAAADAAKAAVDAAAKAAAVAVEAAATAAAAVAAAAALKAKP